MCMYSANKELPTNKLVNVSSINYFHWPTLHVQITFTGKCYHYKLLSLANISITNYFHWQMLPPQITFTGQCYLHKLLSLAIVRGSLPPQITFTGKWYLHKLLSVFNVTSTNYFHWPLFNYVTSINNIHWSMLPPQISYKLLSLFNVTSTNYFHCSMLPTQIKNFVKPKWIVSINNL